MTAVAGAAGAAAGTRARTLAPCACV